MMMVNNLAINKVTIKLILECRLFELYKTKKEAIKAMEAEKEKSRELIKRRKLPVPPKYLPLDDEVEYTQVFQDYFADGIYLNEEITTQLET